MSSGSWPGPDEPSLLRNTGCFLLPLVLCMAPFLLPNAWLVGVLLGACAVWRLRSASTERARSAARSALWSCGRIVAYVVATRFPNNTDAPSSAETS